MKQDAEYDVVVIGGGIVGCLTARELARYRLRVAVVDRAWDVGTGQSTANSAIIHSGHDPEPGTLKAELNVAGNSLWSVLSQELTIPLRRTGALVVALRSEDMDVLLQLKTRARLNDVPGVTILNPAQSLQIEPTLSPQLLGALWTPSAAVIDPFQAVLGPAESAALNGVEFLLGWEVVGADHGSAVGKGEVDAGGSSHRGPLRAIQLVRSHGTVTRTLRARWFVNAAGVHADEVMRVLGDTTDFRIAPRKGEYLVLDQSKRRVNTVIFPTPGIGGKGVLVATTTHGNTIIGPNSAPTTDKDDLEVTAAGIHEIVRGAQRLVPAIDPREAIASYAGLRATGNHEPGGRGRDFLIALSAVVPGLINAAGIESPGLVAAPAIAQRIVALLRSAGESLQPKSEWLGGRKPIPRFKSLSHSERASLVQADAAFGRIVCRCEEVTEAEVLMAMRGPVPARTYDGIKRRTWLGTGRCQGGFDCPRTIDLIARELGIEATAVTKHGPGSEFLKRGTKDAPEGTPCRERLGR